MNYYIQAFCILVAAAAVLFLTFATDEKKVFLFIVLLMPFQPIETRFGSINLAMTVSFSMAVIVKYRINGRRILDLPLLLKFAFAAILFSYVLSLTQVQSGLFLPNTIYIFNFACNYFILLMAVNMFRTESDITKLFYYLGVCSLIVAAFTLFQSTLESKGLYYFGTTEFSVTIQNEMRVSGPYSAQSAFAGFLVIQSIIAIYLFMISAEKAQKIFWAVVLIANFLCLMSTANRLGFLTMLLALLFLSVFFLRNAGFGRSLRFVAVGTVLFVGSLVVVISYTRHNIMLDRLRATEVKGLEVDSRQGLLEYHLKEIQNKPLFGHRPRYELPQDMRGVQRFPPPHNMYIYLLFTVGIFGFLCFMLFFLSLFIELRNANVYWKNRIMKYKSFPTLCLIILVIFLIQQLSVEFIRPTLFDYQQYIFLLFGLFCSLVTISRAARAGANLQPGLNEITVPRAQLS